MPRCVDLRVLPVLLAASVAASGQQAAHAPMDLPGWPAAAVSSGELPTDGRCASVHAGDVVHFTLKLRAADDAHAVFAQMQLTTNVHARFRAADLPLSQDGMLSGGGAGQHDTSDPSLYRFRFVVPDIGAGIYRANGVVVRATYSASSADPGVELALDHHTRTKVRKFCLAVFDRNSGEHGPAVIDFRPNAIEHASRDLPAPLFR